ncbi:MAG TPA: FAD-binding protein, partial [Saprospiraceae bacterium]|nr:FAD-binding protein [Saprospiraceae bacterium]
MSTILGIDTLNYNNVLYYIPKTTDEIATLINEAKRQNKSLVVRGSGHSYPMIPTLEAQSSCIYMLMSKFRKVSFIDSKMQVIVEGGCNLGRDPFDPTGTSTTENSLFYQVFKHGWSIPEMGGIIHQTVGGFLSTGSSGGSVKYSFDEMLTSITIMTAEDPSPVIRTFSKTDENADDFYAAGIALGMYGVILSATFQCLPTFNIQGTEAVTTVTGCAIDLFGNSSENLENHFRNVDYSRLIWWPQSHVQKMV